MKLRTALLAAGIIALSAPASVPALASGPVERIRSTVAPLQVFVVADAWDGALIREAIAAFLEMASGRASEAVDVGGQPVQVGGGSHVVVFVGHNGLMDFPAPSSPPGATNPARAAAVLACASKPYFEPLLARSGAYPLLLSTGFMAPEAYSLEAAVRTWFTTTDPVVTRQAAAEAYRDHQRCRRRAARRLFSAQ